MDAIINYFLELIHTLELSLPSLFNLFSDSRVAITLSGVMVIGAIGIFVNFLFVHFLPVKYALEKVLHSIEETKDAMHFKAEFTRIDKVMEQTSFISHCWYELRKHFIFPQAETIGPIRSTASPSEYFHLQNLGRRSVKINKYQHIPDYLVGIGLTLTFLGLVSGLYFASQGVSAGDSDNARAGLTSLLHSATFKFMTSIAGVGLSVLFSYGYTRLCNSLQISMINVAIALERRLHIATIESVAFAQFNELQTQTELLKEIKALLQPPTKEIPPDA